MSDDDKINFDFDDGRDQSEVHPPGVSVYPDGTIRITTPGHDRVDIRPHQLEKFEDVLRTARERREEGSDE